MSADVKYVSMQCTSCEDSVLAPASELAETGFWFWITNRFLFSGVASRLWEGTLSETCCVPSLGPRGQREIVSVSRAEASHLWGQSLVLC